MQRKNKTHLYVHVPFCRSICYYCDFCHLVYTQKLADSWLDALEKELESRTIEKPVDTVYIGGGTPSCLSMDQLEKLLFLLSPYAHNAEEYTMEMNPETVREENCALLKKYGVNRVSMGVQTSSEKLLKSIGRTHSFLQVKEAMHCLKKAGITNVSLDVLYSLPQQTMQDLQDTVQDVLSLSPTHISLYSLTVEENTVFGKKNLEPLDEDTEADMYDWICSELPKHGYRQYEISNFCREGYASRHNLGYWHYDDFYGVSCGASGKEHHARYDNTKVLSTYLKDPVRKEWITLSREDEEFEMVMMSLRLVEGLDTSLFEERFGVKYEQRYGEKTEKLIQQGWMERAGKYVRCSKKGLPLLNSVLVELMEGE